MKRDYEIIIQQLISKLELINTSDYIKKLYLKKIELLELEIKKTMSSLVDNDIESQIKALDDELNSLIISSNNGKTSIDDFIESKRIKSISQNKHNKQLLGKIKRKAITYLLTLSVMLTSSIYLFEREKSKTKEVLYSTNTYTYSTDYGYNNTSEDYLPKTDSEAIFIKRITPWIIEGKQAKRTIYTYRINNMSLNEILSTNNYENIINNLSFTQENEYKYKNELREYDEYEDAMYKVVYQTQDYNDYKVEYPNMNSKLLALLFCNLLIYILMVRINNGPLIESLLIDIDNLEKSDKQLDIDYEIISSFKRKYRKK